MKYLFSKTSVLFVCGSVLQECCHYVVVLVQRQRRDGDA